MDVTRFGPVHSYEPKFTKEERFRWQSPTASSDVIYVLPNESSARRVFFGTASRGEDSTTIEAKKQTIGPGSYEVGKSFDRNSEYITRRVYRFGNSSRDSMVMKTPSPGAVYNLKNAYWNGPDNRLGISFNCDHRKPLYNTTTGADADPVYPKLPIGRSVTIGKRIKIKPKSSDVPGPIYDVLVSRIIALLRHGLLLNILL